MPDSYTEEQLEGYYRREPEATNKAILAFLRDARNPHMIVFGAQALNTHLPDWLDRETKDWDVVTVGDAQKLATQLENLLDRRYNGDFFNVEPAIHPGTFKVKSKVTGSTVADITLKDKEIEFHRIKGVNYASLDWLEGEAEKLIANPETEFRRAKDKDTLQRIRVFRQYKRKGGRGRGIGRGVRGGRSSRYIDGSSVDTSMRGLR